VANHPSVRLPNMTTDWELEPHAILLRKARKEVWWVEGRPAKSAETREEVLRSKEGLDGSEF
jgi:hypothetical protein